MDANAYFNNLIIRTTKAVMVAAIENAKSKGFWFYNEMWTDSCMSTMHVNYTINSQSKALKKLGGVLINPRTKMAMWIAPKGSKFHELAFMGQGLRHGIYYLLCLKDGRELLLKQTPNRIFIVDHVSPYAYKKIMLELFKELYSEHEGRVKKAIYKLVKEGGYK